MDPNKQQASSYKPKPAPPNRKPNRRHTANFGGAPPPPGPPPAPPTTSNRATRLVGYGRKPPPKKPSFNKNNDNINNISPELLQKFQQKKKPPLPSPSPTSTSTKKAPYMSRPFTLNTPTVLSGTDDDEDIIDTTPYSKRKLNKAKTISSTSYSYTNNNKKNKPYANTKYGASALAQIMTNNNNKNKYKNKNKNKDNVYSSKTPTVSIYASSKSSNLAKQLKPSKSVDTDDKNKDNDNDNDDNSTISRWSNHPYAHLLHQSATKASDDVTDDKDKTPQYNSNQPPPPPFAMSGKIKTKNKNSKNDKNNKSDKNKNKLNFFSPVQLADVDKCNISALLACMHEGSECLKNFHNALTSFGKQQQTQCANFLKLFKKSRSRYAQCNSMPNFYYSISLVHNLLEETVKQSAEFAKFIQISCLPMIRELENQCDTKYDEIYQQTKLSEKKLSKMKQDVNKIRKQSKLASQKCVTARRKGEQTKVNTYSVPVSYNVAGDNKTSKLKNWTANTFNKHPDTDKLIQDTYNNAKDAEKRFKSIVNEYNIYRLKYISSTNNGKQEIINMEHFRVDSMLTVFQKIISQQKKSQSKDANKVFQLQIDINKHIEKMKASSVIKKFVNQTISIHGECNVPEAIESTLDIEYRDIFNSIEDSMSITLEISPHVKIPLIIPLLCERIRDLNGFRTEGIFRKSPPKSVMLKIKKRIQVKNFQLTEDNVHIYASLLKEWLRGLKDLIIPKRYYNYCIDMAKENKLNIEQFRVFFSQLPSVNRESLKYLIDFLRDLIKPQNQIYTKMNLENIAIVFGPTLLMPPHPLEPQTALLNSKAEKQFVVKLIEKASID